MTGVLDSLVNGLALGSVYALIALGFVTIFKASGVLSFTHGSLLLLGGYLVAVLHDDLGFAGALALAIVVTALLAGALDRLLLQRIGTDSHAAHVQTIVTIGIDIVLVTDLARRIGGDLLSTGDPWGDAVTDMGPVTVADSRVAAIVVSGAAIAGAFALFRFTPWGLSLRAAAEDGRPPPSWAYGSPASAPSPGAWPADSPPSPRSSSSPSRPPVWNAPPARSPSRPSRPPSSAGWPPRSAPWSAPC